MLILVVLLDELGYTFIEQPLNQHHILPHIWESATQTELTLQWTYGTFRMEQHVQVGPCFSSSRLMLIHMTLRQRQTAWQHALAML